MKNLLFLTILLFSSSGVAKADKAAFIDKNGFPKQILTLLNDLKTLSQDRNDKNKEMKPWQKSLYKTLKDTYQKWPKKVTPSLALNFLMENFQRIKKELPSNEVNRVSGIFLQSFPFLKNKDQSSCSNKILNKQPAVEQSRFGNCPALQASTLINSYSELISGTKQSIDPNILALKQCPQSSSIDSRSGEVCSFIENISKSTLPKKSQFTSLFLGEDGPLWLESFYKKVLGQAESFSNEKQCPSINITDDTSSSITEFIYKPTELAEAIYNTPINLSNTQGDLLNVLDCHFSSRESNEDKNLELEFYYHLYTTPQVPMVARICQEDLLPEQLVTDSCNEMDIIIRGEEQTSSQCRVSISSPWGASCAFFSEELKKTCDSGNLSLAHNSALKIIKSLTRLSTRNKKALQ